jgi:hypothetical protein
MDKRFKLKEVFKFIRIMRYELKSDHIVTRDEKLNCWKKIIYNLGLIIFNSLTAPFIYPIWYLFREIITAKMYTGTSTKEIVSLMDDNKTEEAKLKLKSNGRILYWIWTYGDADDPLGSGGLPDKYKNNFWNRFKWSAIRNPRFNFYYMEFRTGVITQSYTVLDQRNFKYMHKSFGIGDSPDGIYFKWVKDSDQWYFIYEDNNVDNLFYFGYTGLLRQDIGISGGRFETGYRKTDSSYEVS